MKGLTFLIENKNDNILSKILKNNFSNEFIWLVSEDEVYKKNSNLEYEHFFEKACYDNDEFFKCIEKECYPVFCNLQMYKNNSNINEIKNVDDFYNSDCELIILITDNVFVEIYCKQEEYLSVIQKNLIKAGIKKWKYKDINQRITMYAHGD